MRCHSEFEGLVFDCDGTLADSMPVHWEAWQKVTAKHGLVFPEERFYALGGVPSRHIFKMLGEEQGVEVDPLAASKMKEDLYLEHLHLVQPVHEVVSIAREYHGKIPMSIATGGTRSVITVLLKALEIDHLFDALVTSEDVDNQKPAPDIFLKAASKIGIDPTKCRGFEDTDLGMQAIRSAGMDALDVRLIRK